MMNPEDSPAALQALQDAIYRERILRARSMTPGERLHDVFELSNYSFSLMLDGAMRRTQSRDPETAWAMVENQLSRLGTVHDQGFYSPTGKPAE